MKKIFLVFILSVSFFKSQTSTIDIQDDYLNQGDGFYRKDINNLLNKYEGTYLYTNGNTSLKVTLVKKNHQYNGRYYEDYIIGEYQYILNGIEKINTLNQINTIYNNKKKHKISGNTIIYNNFRMWKCPQCSANEVRLFTTISDPISNRFASFMLRRTILNGQEVMQAKISDVSSIISSNPLLPTQIEFSLPKGEFTMIKQK